MTKTANDKLCKIIAICLPVLSVLLTTVLFFYMPDSIPTKWDFSGHPTAHSANVGIMFIYPACALLFVVVLMLLPRIDPQKVKLQQGGGIYYWMIAIIATVLTAVNGLYILWCYYLYSVQLLIVTKVILALAILYTGNYLPKIKDNSFIGIVNPWTLSSGRVWSKTHRFAGRLMVGLGAVLMILAFFVDTATNIATCCIWVGLIIIPHAYSLRQFTIYETLRNSARL